MYITIRDPHTIININKWLGLLFQIYKEFQEINKWKLNQKEGKEYE